MTVDRETEKNAELDQVHQAASLYLNKIAEFFKPGVRVTLLVRSPDNDEADFVLSSDDLELAVEALKRRMGA